MKSPMQITSYVSVLLLIIFAFSCNEEPPIVPPPPNGEDSIKNTINIELIWKELKAVSLKISPSTQDTGIGYTYTLKRYDESGSEKLIFQTSLNKDTTIIDNDEGTGLNPGEQYRYKVEGRNTEGELKDTSQTLTIKTLAPTSHNFTWQVDTLGQPGNFLKDVWGMDENNVWAVGYVDLPEDGSGIIKWNGSKWSTFPTFAGIKQGIFGLDENNIFVVGEFGAYGVVGIWDGGGWNVRNFFYDPIANDTVWALRGIWGNSPEDVWAVGDKGTIIHWDGTQWTKVKCPVNLLLYDIWGTSPDNIYAVRISLANQSQLIHYDGNNWTEITNQLPPGERNLTSLWFDKGGTGYIVGNNVLYYNGGSFNRIEVNQDKFLLRVRGTNSTDVFAVGQKGRIHHFNGMDWAVYPELFDETPGMELRGVFVTETTVFAVGLINGGSIIYKGSR